MKVCRKVNYEGYVQGVGFRFRAVQLAENYAITGYVKNLPDGQVEIIAEGEEKEVSEFFERVKESMSYHIRRTVETNEPPTRAYKDFSIR